MKVNHLTSTLAMALGLCCLPLNGFASAELEGITVTEQKENPNLKVTPTSVGPISLGMPSARLPKSVPSLYDSFKTTHFDQEYDEFNDCMEPAHDHIEFFKAGKLVMEAYDEGKGIFSIHVKAPYLSHKGVHPGMRFGDALKKGMRVYQNGWYECGDARSALTFNDGVHFIANVSYTNKGAAKMRAAADKAYKISTEAFVQVPINNMDYIPTATILEFYLQQQ